MKRKVVLEIDGRNYMENDIASMGIDQIKMLISFVDDENDLYWIKLWADSDVIDAYVDNLLDTIKRVMPEN